MDADSLAKILWDFEKLDQKLELCDGIIVPGSHDNNPARYAVELLKNGYGGYIIFSGGVLQNDPLTFTKNTKTEAEIYHTLALSLEAPQDKIFIENKATNTAENIKFSLELVKEEGLPSESIILVGKPYNVRRHIALTQKQFPGIKFIVVSEPITFEEYTSRGIPKKYIYESMVGDLQRLKIYGENGFQMPVEIPPEVWAAYEKLVETGYTRRMVKE